MTNRDEKRKNKTVTQIAPPWRTSCNMLIKTKQGTKNE